MFTGIWWNKRNKDKAVLLVSFELDEIMNLSDRIEVIFDGQITGEVLGEDADEKELGLLMAGGKKDEVRKTVYFQAMLFILYINSHRLCCRCHTFKHCKNQSFGCV